MRPWVQPVARGFTREQFRQYIATLGPAPQWVQFCVLHNTAVPTLTDWHKVSGSTRMAGLADYYRNVQHWSAGPHLFVADDLIWVFTPLDTTGVHSPSWNHCSWGVEQAGDFETEPYDSGAGALVRDNAAFAIAVLSRWRGLDSSTIKPHHADPLTTHRCPGKNVVMGDFQQRVHSKILELKVSL